MRKILLIGILVIAGISIGNRQKTVLHINDIIKPYYEEIIKELEDEGIEIPYQESITIGIDPLMNPMLLGYAIGMNDDRRVLIQINTKLISAHPNQLRYVLLHELLHDIFNVYHYGNGLMKPSSTGLDAYLYEIDKAKVISELKEMLKKRKLSKIKIIQDGK